MQRKKIKTLMTGYSFLAPNLLLLSIFTILPIFMVFYFSFTDYSGRLSANWVDFENYLRILKDPAVKYAIKNTLVFVLLVVPFVTLISLCVAGILAQQFRNRFGSLVRSSLFVPVVCSLSLLGSIWYYLFSSDPNGVVNTLLSFFGFNAIDWFGRSNTAMFALCFVNIVRGVGYFLVIYYAAIMEIPRSYLEAAEVDGANRFQQFIRIILPNLKNTTYFVITINTIWGFQVFDLAYTMTRGGPGYGTSTMIYRIYQEGFWNWKMGYACALSVLLFIMIIVISSIIKRIFLFNNRKARKHDESNLKEKTKAD